MTTLALITRCRDEPYVDEFVNHYLHEGVDALFIIDDESQPGTYERVARLPNVHVVTDVPFRNGPELDTMYQRIRDDFEWVLVVDMDEYVTTKAHPTNRLKDELQSTFSDADCVMIPWVMMAFDGLERNPPRLLETNTSRWNHDRRHDRPSAPHKLRCRYDAIEVKCVFRTGVFEHCWLHGPSRPDLRGVSVVDSIRNQPTELGPFHESLRERDIEHARLLCLHYRVVSLEHCRQKLADNHIDGYRSLTPDELARFDYPEIVDETLARKSKRRSWLVPTAM